MVLEVSFQEPTNNKYVCYIKQRMVYAKDIHSIEIHHVLNVRFFSFFSINKFLISINFLSAIFDKVVQNMQWSLFFIFQHICL